MGITFHAPACNFLAGRMRLSVRRFKVEDDGVLARFRNGGALWGDIQLLKTGVEVRRVRMWRVARSGCTLFRVEELMGRDNEIHIGVFVPVECVVRRDG